MRVYIAGPMTGIPQFNFPAFDAAAQDLRVRGYDVVSPAEMDDPETRRLALASTDGAPGSGTSNGETWGDFLARDVKLIADEGIEGIVCLDGWERSKGARLETFIARLSGLPIYRYAPDLPDGTQRIPDATVAAVHGPANHATGEERVIDPKTGGMKGRKPQQMSLLPWDVLMRDIAPLYAKGAAKYERDNWRKGYAWSLSFDALARHLAQFHAGDWLDAETECPHLASVVFHACALLYFHGAHPDLNDLTA